MVLGKWLAVRWAMDVGCAAVGKGSTPTPIVFITAKPIRKSKIYRTPSAAPGRNSGVAHLFFLDTQNRYAILGYSIYLDKKVIVVPIYEYQCNECGKEFEKMVRFTEASVKPVCPSCQSQDTKKKISSFASLGSSLSGSGASTSSSCSSSSGFN